MTSVWFKGIKKHCLVFSIKGFIYHVFQGIFLIQIPLRILALIYKYWESMFLRPYCGFIIVLRPRLINCNITGSWSLGISYFCCCWSIKYLLYINCVIKLFVTFTRARSLSLSCSISYKPWFRSNNHIE